MSRDEWFAEYKRTFVEVLVHEQEWGLWEPYWELRSSMPDTEAIAIAEQALRELYADDLIWLYRWTWGMSERPENPDPLPPDEVAAEIAASWWRDIPLESADVYIAPTPKAEAVIANPS
jgi:hypothetical protein